MYVILWGQSSGLNTPGFNANAAVGFNVFATARSAFFFSGNHNNSKNVVFKSPGTFKSENVYLNPSNRKY